MMQNTSPVFYRIKNSLQAAANTCKSLGSSDKRGSVSRWSKLGGYHPYGWLLQARNALSKDLYHHQSPLHGNPHQLQCCRPIEDSRTQDIAHGLKP